MRLVIVLAIAASTRCAQAAPQFNSFASSNWRSTEFPPQGEGPTNYENRNHYGRQSIYPQYNPQTEHQQRNDPDDRRPSNQCWDPVNQAYKDSSQSENTNLPGPSNRNPSKNQNPNFPDQSEGPWGRPQSPYRPPPRDYWNGHGPFPPPQHGHGHPPHHGYGRPPPPPPHPSPPPHHGHGHGHGHGPPPHYGHGYGHEPPPPPPPPDYGYGHGPPPPPYGGNVYGAPLPPQRPPHYPQDVNDDELQICTEISRENTSPNSVASLATSTQGDSGVVNIPSSSEAPKQGGGHEELGTQTTTDSSVKGTTEFDWNNYFPGASVDNPGGEGVIDVRGDFSSDTLSAV